MYTHTHTHTHNGVLLSHKKNVILPCAATWMDLENIIFSEVSQKKVENIPLTCGSKKMTQMNLFTRQKQTHRL